MKVKIIGNYDRPIKETIEMIDNPRMQFMGVYNKNWFTIGIRESIGDHSVLKIEIIGDVLRTPKPIDREWLKEMVKKHAG